MIHIVDYNCGNIKSIKNMINRIGEDVNITNDPCELKNATKLILPGVGNFDYGMRMLNDLGLKDVLNTCVLVNKVPILGICLGAQLMTNSSEESSQKGLGWLDAKVVLFKKQQMKNDTRIPHMGWNKIKELKESSLFDRMDNNNKFYFVHSYHFLPVDNNIALTETYHGYNFVSSLLKDNIIGVQFHPEKSHKYGMNLLENFIAL